MIVLLILACGAPFCFTVEQNTSTIWQNPTNLSKYQLAWNTLNKSQQDIYYQVVATSLMNEKIYTTPDFFEPADFKCWSVQYINQNEAAKTASRRYSYGLTARSRLNEVYDIGPEKVNIKSVLNYTSPNGVEYEYKEDEPKETDRVIFTDGKTCDLFNVPRTNEGKGCELWVKSEYKENIPPCCSFIYDLLCGAVGSYDVYEKNFAQMW
uniref:Putative lipocal-1 1 n=1 Tax=Amblyomma cajennense TaxID=34607 RepID=A0A023FU83_AMBCJ